MQVIDIADASADIIAQAAVLSPILTNGRQITPATFAKYKNMAIAERKKGDNRYRVYLAIKGPTLVGAATTSPDKYTPRKHLAIYVVPEYRGQGIAEILWQRATAPNGQYLSYELDAKDFYKPRAMYIELANGQYAYLQTSSTQVVANPMP